MNAILLDAQGQEVEQRTITPRRVRLTRAVIDRFADVAGVQSPAAQMVASTGSLDSLGDRLGTLGHDAAPDRAAAEGEVAATPATGDPDDLLEAA